MAENDKGFFQNKSDMLGTALIMTILSFFLINWGVNDGAWLFWLGTIVLFLGLLLAPLSRFTAGTPEDEEEEEGQQGSQAE